MALQKKYIAPGAWFSMSYPASWNEFEDTEDSFLFYNPDEWTGNFRISAYRGGATYGEDCVRQELQSNPLSRRVRVGGLTCAYCLEDFEENGAPYTTHFWVTGIGNTAFECSFTVSRGGDVTEAEQVVCSLQVREEGRKYPAELIPVRLSEIYQIDEAYDWAARKVKEVLKKDFQGVEADVDSLRQLMEQSPIAPKKREAWLSLGIVLCVILANEVDGWEWRTLVDGNREAPVLQHVETQRVIDPMKLLWSKVKAGEAVCLPEIYEAMPVS